MVEIKMGVEKMMCGMCESHISDAIRQIQGVKSVKTSRKQKNTCIIAENNVDIEQIKKTVTSLGYDAGEVSVSDYTPKGFFEKLRCGKK